MPTTDKEGGKTEMISYIARIFHTQLRRRVARPSDPLDQMERGHEQKLKEVIVQKI